MDALEEIKIIRKDLKKRCPTLSVRNGRGTAWGWVEISGSGPGGNFTLEEKATLRAIGLNPGGNFEVISPEERRQRASKILTKGGGIGMAKINAKVYTTVGVFPSKSNPNKTYTVKKDQNGDLSCDCRGWTVKKPGKERTCTHVQQVEANQPTGQLTPEPTPLAKPALAGKTQEGGNLEDLFKSLDEKGL